VGATLFTELSVDRPKSATAATVRTQATRCLYSGWDRAS